MSVIADVFKMLFKMFVADFRLTVFILAGVAVVGVLLKTGLLAPLWGGGALLLLSLAVLAETVLREARK